MAIKQASVMKGLCSKELFPSSLAAKHWLLCLQSQREARVFLRAPHLCHANCSVMCPWIFCLCWSEINYAFHQCKSSAIWRAFGRFMRSSDNCKDKLFSCLAGESFNNAVWGFAWQEHSIKGKQSFGWLLGMDSIRSSRALLFSLPILISVHCLLLWLEVIAGGGKHITTVTPSVALKW